MAGSEELIYFKDLESRFIRCSEAMARNFSVKNAKELVGKRDSDFFSNEHASEAFNDEQTIIRTGEPIVGKAEKETGRPDKPVEASELKRALQKAVANSQPRTEENIVNPTRKDAPIQVT